MLSLMDVLRSTDEIDDANTFQLRLTTVIYISEYLFFAIQSNVFSYLPIFVVVDN